MNYKDKAIHCVKDTVYIQKDVPDALIAELIEHSAEEVIKRLPKKRQEEYRKM